MKQKKGCGKHYCDNKIWFNCGDRWGNLCPACENQSPHSVSGVANPESKVIREGTSTLSDKICFTTYDTCRLCIGLKFVKVEDVQEFIRRRNRLDMMLRKKEITWNDYVDERNKLAGSKLLEGGKKDERKNNWFKS